MLEKLYKVYWALEKWIVPGLQPSQNVYARILSSRVTPATRWVDLGCGHQLFPGWIPGQKELASRPRLLVGLDPDIDSLRKHATIQNRVAALSLPFRDGAFDLLTANMVFEHLSDPMSVLQEIRRVLAADGICLFHTPNRLYWKIMVAQMIPQTLKNKIIRVMEHREEEDVYPTHYRINTHRRIHELCLQSGFEVQELLMTNTSSVGRIVLGPFVILELLWIRMLQLPLLNRYRSNIIAVIRPVD